MRLLILIAVIALSGCAFIDEIGDTSQVSTVQAQVTVELVSATELSAICNKRTAIACYVNERIYLQGEAGTYSADITVEYLSWGDLGDKCGRFTGGSSCYEDGTIFTSSTYGLNNAYHTGVIGDLLAAAMGIDIGLNRREQLGHEVFHLLGVKDPDHVSGTANLGGL